MALMRAGTHSWKSAFDAGVAQRIILNVEGAFEDGVFFEAEVDLGFEEEGDGEEGFAIGGGDDQGATALGSEGSRWLPGWPWCSS